MANSDADITEGSGFKVAAYSFSEDAVTRNVQRVALNDSTGAEILLESQLNDIETAIGDVETAITAAATSTVAHDAAATSINPLLVGLYAHLTQPTAVSTTTDAVRAFGDADGAAVIRNYANLPSIVTGTLSNTDGARTAVIAASGDAAIKHYLTDVMIFNTSASAVVCDIEDGTTVKASFLIPAGGGVVKTFGLPIPGTANTAWNINAASATTTIYATYIGFKSKV